MQSRHTREVSASLRLVNNFRKDQSWKAAKWTREQFEELVEPVIAFAQAPKTSFQDRRVSSMKHHLVELGADISSVIGREKIFMCDQCLVNEKSHDA